MLASCGAATQSTGMNTGSSLRFSTAAPMPIRGKIAGGALSCHPALSCGTEIAGGIILLHDENKAADCDRHTMPS